MPDPFKVVRDFELEVCKYTGARYCVTTNSCTMAILLACAWKKATWKGEILPTVSVPKHTYVSVPMSVIHAGFKVSFRHSEWLGRYDLYPLDVVDSARLFTSNMYQEGMMQCVSFHASKTLGDTQGGAILHDDQEADEWLRRARFDGRMEGVPVREDSFWSLGWHCYMSPDVAARLMWKLSRLPRHNDPLPNDDYPDLSSLKIFQ